jgi:hypothetical protein
MVTITEDYVSFETAKLLKGKGFNEKLLTYYLASEDEKEYYFQIMAFTDDKIDNNHSVYCYLAPTLQMAMKWLREVHKLAITVSIGNENNKGNTDYSNPDRWFYFFDITNEKGVVIDTEYDPLSNEFPTYEEACEAAIKYCLENLI